MKIDKNKIEKGITCMTKGNCNDKKNIELGAKEIKKERLVKYFKHLKRFGYPDSLTVTIKQDIKKACCTSSTIKGGK